MQSLNFFKKTLHIYHIYVRLSNLYMIIKMCVAAKILEICIFCFFGFPLNFDEEKWYCMYIEQFLKNDIFYFLSQFHDPDLEPLHIDGPLKTTRGRVNNCSLETLP